MRIIAGSLGGRRLGTPKGARVRPTADRVKESLFSILEGRLQGARVLDLFAGSGALGLEALSRGAREAVFVEKDPLVARVLTSNIESLGATAAARVVRGDAGRVLPTLSPPFDLVFVDPPYGKGLAAAALASLGAPGSPLAGGALVVAEHSRRDELLDSYGSLACLDRRRYGDTELSFYTHAAPETAAPPRSA